MSKGRHSHSQKVGCQNFAESPTLNDFDNPNTHILSKLFDHASAVQDR